MGLSNDFEEDVQKEGKQLPGNVDISPSRIRVEDNQFATCSELLDQTWDASNGGKNTRTKKPQPVCVALRWNLINA